VALVVPGFRGAPVAVKTEEEILPVPEDFTLDEAETAEEIPTTVPVAATEAPAEILPAPPELPQIAEFEPLPEIPEISPVAAKPSPAPVQVIAKPRPTQAGKSTSTAKPAKPGGAPGTASPGASDSSRLAQGRMAKPSYPAQAKRAGQTGTVVIEFTVDASGRVISAYPKSSSGWPLLDTEAVRTVRRWTFPAGGVMKLQRPIVFQLR
jgi:protein TonB